MHSISTVDADIKKNGLLPESLNILETERKKIRESVGLNVFNHVFLFFLFHYVETSSFSNEIGAGMLVNTGVCLCVLVCVFCVSPFLSPRPSHRRSHSLNVQAGMFRFPSGWPRSDNS